MDFLKLFREVAEHPRMFLLDDRYVTLVALVTGCDLATGGRLLDGFPEWLWKKILDSERSQYYWSTIVASRHRPELLEGQVSEAEFTAEENRQASRDLLDLLCEFLTFKNTVGVTLA